MSDMRGKTVLITGANQGIGKVSALELGKMGARVILVCRNAEKGRAAADEVLRAGASAVDLIVGNVGVQAEVRRIADEVKARHDRLDVLLNNAGVLVTERRETVDGIEETFAVNHLGYFLLTHHLRDLLVKSAPSRIVNVSSGAHASCHDIDWNDVQKKKGWTSFGAYAQSKLCNILFTRELARRLDGTNVTANCLHPGAVGTGFGHTDGGVVSVVFSIAKPFLLTAEKGARTQVWLASSPEVASVTGKYFVKCKERWPTRLAQRQDWAERLWALSEELTGLSPSARRRAS